METTINARFKEIRKSCNMTKESFALKLGVSRSSIEYVESGRNQPNVVLVTKLHQHFPQFSLEYILYGQNEGTDKNEIIDIQKHDSAQHSFTPTYPFLDYRLKKLFQANANIKKAAGMPQTTSKKEEAKQAIADLERGIAILKSWMDDMDDEGFYLPNE